MVWSPGVFYLIQQSDIYIYILAELRWLMVVYA